MTNASPAFLSAADLMAGDVAPREFILEPLLAGNGIGLLYGPAGIGKSFVALGIAWAAASGGSFLGWRAPRPRRVLYIDGEMGEVDMRERLALFGPEPPGLDFWLAGRDDGPGLQLDTLEGQLRLMESWDWPDLVVLDGTAGLTGRTTGDAGYSRGLQHFLLWLKQCQRAVLVVGETNRKGQLRGTSRGAGVPDLVLALRRPAGARVADGALLEIHVEKARCVAGAALAPVLARLVADAPGEACWEWQSMGLSALDRAIPLLRQGLDAPALGRALGVSRATAFRLQRRARQCGVVLNPRPLEKPR